MFINMPAKKIIKKPVSTENTVELIDYLTEDPIFTGQKFVCVSFLKPSQLEEKYRTNDLTVCGFKVRGSFDSYEEAQKRCEFLQKVDEKFNIYIAEVGKWCPFEDNPEKAKDSEYMNKDLNKLMKNYWKQQSDAKEFHEIRKQEMVNKALEEVEKKKKDNNDNDNDDEQIQELDEQSINQISKAKKNKKTKKVDKNVILNDLKSDLDENKKDLEKEKKEVDDNINTLRKLEDELAEKIKEMEAEALEKGIINKINF